MIGTTQRAMTIPIRTISRFHSLALGACAFLLIASGAAGQVDTGNSQFAAVPVANELCPVMPDQPTDSQFQTTYNGRRIHFCCADCVRQFESDPASYVGNLPAPNSVSLPTSAREPWTDYVLRHAQPIVAVLDYAANHPWFTGYVVAVTLLFALAVRKRRRLAAGKTLPRWSDRFSRPFARPATLIALVLAGVCTQLIVELSSRPAESPTPTPRAPAAFDDEVSTFAWPQALQEIPRGLSNVYYRGNDERNERLFNGGRYRTATLYVSVRGDEGVELKPGMAVNGTTLSLHCRIMRAANTASGFFAKPRMEQFRLIRARGTDPNTESVPLNVLRDDWEWVAVGRIGRPVGHGYEGLRGVWYLGGDSFETRHFGIQYCIHVQDGKVLPESVVWMYAILQSPTLNGPTADREWFSDRPIPEIPDGKNVTDPKLLGLDRPDAPKNRGKTK
jgi:YHS domain-containing protein